MTLDNDRKPNAEDFLRAIDRYVRARIAKAADEKRAENGGRLDWEVSDELTNAIENVETALNSLIDQRVEEKIMERLNQLGIVSALDGA